MSHQRREYEKNKAGIQRDKTAGKLAAGLAKAKPADISLSFINTFGSGVVDDDVDTAANADGFENFVHGYFSLATDGNRNC
jgi:hypothetical protein